MAAGSSALKVCLVVFLAGFALLREALPIDVPSAQESLLTCAQAGSCTIATTSGPDGKFALTVPFLTGLQLVATGVIPSETTSGFETYSGLLSVSQCSESPVSLPVDYHRLSILSAILSDNNSGFAGSLVVTTDVASCFIQSGNGQLFGTNASRSQEIPPTNLGPWIQMDLVKLPAPNKVGTVSFIVGSTDSPVSGTWEARDQGGQLLIGGTWSEGGF